ncbi:EF-hand domain-containing protein [Notoacmeibacter marinus]|uniref:EF-hand domain-containing protein n=1 Tax=Notoacmeibacter marinus TaxID=1876515 RepID=UPI000DF22665|nr:EF-hand domain-containing protein [Notoacmeibacter marinus]
MFATTLSHATKLGLAGLTALAALTVTSPAMAQQEIRMIFAEMDADADGAVSEDEHTDASKFYAFAVMAGEPRPCDFGTFEELFYSQSVYSDDFDDLDTNGDGSIAFEEMRVAYVNSRSDEFISFDTDSNGFLSPEEYRMALIDLERAVDVLLSDSCADESVVACPGEPTDDEPTSAERDDPAIEDETVDVADQTGEESELLFEPRVMFAAVDENRDGRISYQEYIEN